MHPLFGPIPGVVESVLAFVLEAAAVLFLALVAHRWVRALRRVPAAFRAGFRDVSSDDVRTFLTYAIPVLAAELLAVAVLWPDAVTPPIQATVLAFVLFFATLAFAALASLCYLALRRFADGYRAGRG